MSKPVYLKLGTSLIAATEDTAPKFLATGYEPATEAEVEAAKKQSAEALRRFNQRNAINQATQTASDPSKLPKLDKTAKPAKKD